MLRYHLKASGGIYPVITIADVGFRGCNGTGFEAFSENYIVKTFHMRININHIN